ncbi:prolyl oligopeptidase family serine peptidase [Undibacterium sp. Ji67W]|uniref:prolyl oligopeptidase family serine peptidase n=1 Tax=Undibacterium sp. Ji67W TaxID=3413042 RepID=UPI003BEFEC0D
MLKKSLLGCLLMGLMTFPASAQLQAWGDYPAVPRPVLIAGGANNRELSQVDPLRSLQNLDGLEVRSWLKKQNELARQIFDRIDGRNELLARLRDLDIASRVKKTVVTPPLVMKVMAPPNPQKAARIDLKIPGALIYTQFAADQRARLIMRNEVIGGERVLYVENTNEHLLRVAAAPDLKHLALMLEQPSGEVLIRVVSLPDGELSEETIFCASAASIAEPSMIWTADSSALIYSQSVAASNLNKTDIWLHVIGQLQKKDKIIIGSQALGAFAKRIKMTSMDVPVITALTGTPLLLLSISSSEEKTERIADGKGRSYFYVNQSEIKTTEIPWKNFAMPIDKVQSLIQEGEQLFLLTNKKSASGEILKMDLSKASDKLQLSQFKEFVKAGTVEIKDMVVSKDYLFWHAMTNGNNRISRLFKMNRASGASDEIALPEIGVLTQLRVDRDKELLTFNLQAANASPGTYTMTPQGKTTVVTAAMSMQSEVVKEMSPVQKKSLMITVTDGRTLSVTLSYLPGFNSDGAHPALLRITSGSDVANETGDMAWFENGGMIANLNLHIAESQSLKTIDTASDVAAVARYLVKERYASPKKLVAEEMRAGGNALVKSILRQPDLFVAAAVHDVASEEMSKNAVLAKPKSSTSRSAYEELRADVGYPAILLTADSQSPSAPMWMSAKLAAGLQILSINKNKPVLLQTERQGDVTTDILVQKANRWAFFLWQLGDPKFSLQLLANK